MGADQLIAVDPDPPGEPRADERLDTSRLEGYLREQLPETAGEMWVLQFPGGRANLTYLIGFGDTEYVLRRPPLGPIAPSAHDMGRENRVLSKLYAHFELAPRSFLYCEDESIIGASFQVMERRRGIVIRQEIPPPFGGDKNAERHIGKMLIDVMADLHLVDREAAQLEDLGRPEGFVERQLEGWAGRWDKSAHEDNLEMSNLVEWLRKHRTESRYVALLHNDYKLDNVLVSNQKAGRAVAVLDWDMCTSGDPLMDLGYLLNHWADPSDPPHWLANTSMPSTAPGFPRRAEIIERYSICTGFDVSNIHWYYAFSAMKLAVIIQQIFIRFHRGQTQDQRFADYDERARAYISKGCVIAGID